MIMVSLKVRSLIVSLKRKGSTGGEVKFLAEWWDRYVKLGDGAKENWWKENLIEPMHDIFITTKGQSLLLHAYWCLSWVAKQEIMSVRHPTFFSNSLTLKHTQREREKNVNCVSIQLHTSVTSIHTPYHSAMQVCTDKCNTSHFSTHNTISICWGAIQKFREFKVINFVTCKITWCFPGFTHLSKSPPHKIKNFIFYELFFFWEKDVDYIIGSKLSEKIKRQTNKKLHQSTHRQHRNKKKNWVELWMTEMFEKKGSKTLIFFWWLDV